MIELQQLSKRFGDAEVVKGLTFDVAEGTVLGFLGPNGAGKSTIINIMAGLVIKSSGSVKIWGYDIEKQMRQARSAIGIVPQELNIDPFFTPREILDVQAGLYGVPKSQRRTMEILEAVHLSDKAEAYARTLSGGMRRRLLVAKAMVHTPPVLVLDEPTAGVDVELRQQLWSYIRHLRDKGTTILLTTHYLEEAEELCDQIAIINKGEVVTCQPTEELLRSLDHKEFIVTVNEELTEVPERLSRFKVELQNKHMLVFRVPPSQVPVEDLLQAVQAVGLTIRDLTTKESDLEDIFLMMTQGSEKAMSFP